MKKYLIRFSFILSSISFFAQSLNDLDFGSNLTFEVVTWNIEHFPKNGSTTLDYVIDIIEAMDADLLAIQEINDREAFQYILNNLPGHDGFYTNNGFQELGYIFRTDVIQATNVYEIYTNVGYPSPFTKPPYVMEFSYLNEDFIIINNHFKCCGDGTLETDDQWDEENRRFLASNLIKDYIDTNLTNQQVFVVGDLNDVLTDIPDNNVFQSFIEDSNNYVFADMDIAQGTNTNWSYPTWPSHLDHILITNELFDEFLSTDASIETLKIETYLTNGWSEYDMNVSDHRPVGLKIPINSIGINDLSLNEIGFRNYPNPAIGKTTFHVNGDVDFNSIVIYTSTGQQIAYLSISKGQNSFVWDTAYLPNGIYFASLKSSTKNLANLKILIAN